MKKLLIILFLLTGIASWNVLKAQSTQHYEVKESEVIYKTINGQALKMLIYEPKMTRANNLPAIVFYHGGGWNVGTYKLFQHHARYMASRGMVAFSPQYRIGTMVAGTTVDRCLMDGKSAIRYIKANAAAYNIDPNKIVSSGTSAGGLLAGGLAIIDEFNESTDDLSISPKPCAAVLYCPSILIDRDNLNDAYKERFNGLEENLSCYHQVKSGGLPPFLVMSGDADTQTTIDGMRLFDAKMKEFGNESELIEYPKQGHGFMMLDRSVKYFIATVKETETFLAKHIEFKAPAWIEDYVISLGYDIEADPDPGVYKVGATREYKKLQNLWKELLEEDPGFLEDELTVYIDEGIYTEGELKAFPEKKVRLIGAGADKTIIRRNSALELISDLTKEVRYGYLFRSARNATLIADNFELICENIGFERIGGTGVNWGGALVVNEVANQKYTFRNCTFSNIYARQGALVSFNPQNPTSFSLTMENCFVEDCGTYEFNHNAGLISLKYGGDISIKNTTFMNNRFHLYNTDATKTATDFNRKSGLIMQLDANATYPSKLLFENVNIVNSLVNAETTSFSPQIKINGNAASLTSCTFKNLMMIENLRSSTPDCDMFFPNITTFVPIIESSVFNVLKQVENVSISSFDGVKLGTDISYTSDDVDFDMDGNLPKIYKDENGVKYLKRGVLSSKKEIESLDAPVISVRNNVMTVSGLYRSSGLSIYTVTGTLLKEISVGNENVEIALNKGIYIVKTASKTTKVII